MLFETFGKGAVMKSQPSKPRRYIYRVTAPKLSYLGRELPDWVQKLVLPEPVRLVRLSYDDLGLPSQAGVDELIARAITLGYQPCPDWTVSELLAGKHRGVGFIYIPTTSHPKPYCLQIKEDGTARRDMSNCPYLNRSILMLRPKGWRPSPPPSELAKPVTLKLAWSSSRT